LDTCGCLLAGLRTPAARAAGRAATLDGTSRSLLAHRLGVAAAALDYDDGHYEGGGIHLGAVIVPALLAAPPADGDGERLLTALAVGYEVAIRAGWLMAPRAPGDPYHTSGYAACLGAAVAVAKLRGLDAGGIRGALRIAAAYGPIATLQLPAVKESIGWAAATAITAVDLATAGFVDAAGALDAPSPLGIAATPFATARAAEPFVAGIGRDWHAPAAYLKPYACCRGFHAALDAIVELLAETGVGAGQVEAVEVEVMAPLAMLDYLPAPTTEHAQFSFPFAIGCLLASGQVLPASFLPAALADPGVNAAAARVRLRANAELVPLAAHASYPARVSLRLPGQVLCRRIDHASGSAARPLSEARVTEKFLANAALVMAPSAGQQWLEILSAPVPRTDALLRALSSILQEY
ncbi:MAG: MmgE/PrpD family protein, partial [Pseudomonas sp.]